MPLRHAPIVEWPTMLAPLLHEVQITTGSDGKRICRLDVEVDAETLLAIHEFEAHLRRCPVQLRLAENGGCVIGEMNSSFSLGAPSDPIRHIAKLRLSFHDLQDGECVDLADSD